MKQVLFVSYYFPPQPEAGAVRAGALAQHLPEFGWLPTVISLAAGSPPPYAGPVLAAPNLLIPAPAPIRPPLTADAAPASVPRRRSLRERIPRRIRRAYWSSTQLHFPDPAMGWILPALAAGRRALAHGHFHAVISSAHPPSAHLVAAALARRAKLPWIADYRDLWTGYPYSRKSSARQCLERRLERATVRHADAITTVSPALGEELRALFPAQRVIVIPNGVDLVAHAGAPSQTPNGFRIVYAGQLYGGRRTPEALFAAVRNLRKRGEPAGSAIALDFYGGEEPVVDALADRYGIGDAVRAFPRVDRESVLLAQRRAALLLVLLSLDPATANEYGSKLFEYVGAGRPVLAIGPAASVVRDYLSESGLGSFAWDAASCERALLGAYERFVRGEYAPQLVPGWTPFTTRDLAERFARTLAEIEGP
ncbi:MAG: glycosyltransferase [Candidatus Velthaea sp.]